MSTRSIWLRARTAFFSRALRPAMTRSVSATTFLRPSTRALASMTWRMTSAPAMPSHADSTMARAMRSLPSKMPGVSTRTSCEVASGVRTMAIPRTWKRVVCTLCVTMLTFSPTKALVRVDFPALGAPMTATTPALVLVSSATSGSAMFREDVGRQSVPRPFWTALCPGRSRYLPPRLPPRRWGGGRGPYARPVRTLA